MKTYVHDRPFVLESGAALPQFTLAYQTYGHLNEARSNVVWVCHALTGNAEAADWWSTLIGPGKLLDPARYFIVCANALGSCYGSTGPASINPETGEPYGLNFPNLTTRDMARAYDELREYLGLDYIHLLIGGSMGGQQALEWVIERSTVFDHVVLIACNARHSAWGVAFNATQRMALETDPAFGRAGEEVRAGLAAARAVAMLSYRSYETYAATQTDDQEHERPSLRADGYQRYQGEKFRRRFDPYSYYTLSRAMDAHHVGRGRGGIGTALGRVQARTLVVGIQSDVLFPVSEQVFLSARIPDARLEVVDSLYGHDGFLVEIDNLTEKITAFLENRPSRTVARRSKASILSSLPGSEVF